MEYRLLEKTEIRISPIRLTGADLGACALAAARALDLSPEDVMVTDAVEHHLTLDILVSTIQADQIVARENVLLHRLEEVPGISISSETHVHSDGILGLISLDEKKGKELLERSRTIETQLSNHIRNRSIVFSTGKEVLAGQIRDTNTPFLIKALTEAGYRVTRGPVLDDKVDVIARAFWGAAEAGYGLVITSGGIGAEGKDQTLEALIRVDIHADTPYILKFQKGQGRHHKDSVRIGVGILERTFIVCLPGPHEEVRLTWPVLHEGIRANWDKEVLAEALAGILRNKFLARSRHNRPPSEKKEREVAYGVE